MKRYCIDTAGETFESPQGSWVKYKDANEAIESLRRELAIANRALKLGLQGNDTSIYQCKKYAAIELKQEAANG